MRFAAQANTAGQALGAVQRREPPTPFSHDGVSLGIIGMNLSGSPMDDTVRATGMTGYMPAQTPAQATGMISLERPAQPALEPQPSRHDAFPWTGSAARRGPARAALAPWAPAGLAAPRHRG